MKSFQNIVKLFIDASYQFKGKTAIIEKDRFITYTQLRINVINLASQYKSKGLVKGDRVLVFVPMSIDLYQSILALFYIGAVPVFLDEWSSLSRLNHAANVANCKGYISLTKGRIFSYFVKSLRSIPIKLTPHVKISQEHDSKMAQTEGKDDAIITLSTGSTGLPKAAIRSHNMLYSQYEALMKYIQQDEDKPDMTALPIVLLINLGLGKTSIIPDTNLRKLHKMNVKGVYHQIINYNIGSISSSPFFMQQLAKYKRNQRLDKDKIKDIIIGGAPCYPAEAEYIQQHFPDAKTRIVYGSTEAEPISSVFVPDLLAKHSTKQNGLYVGNIHSVTDLKIIDMIEGQIEVDNGPELDILEKKRNQIGEIIVQGPHVLRHYINNPLAEGQNKIVMRDSFWHRTGDSGYIDNQGHLYLTGRCGSLINHEEKVLAPFVYENQFSLLENVNIGTIMQIEGQLLVVLELIPHTTLPSIEVEIHEICPNANRIITLSKIPRDLRHHSKIDYIKLREIIIN